MESLFENFNHRLAYTRTTFVRSLMDYIHWDARLIGIRGSRGVGKTTLMLQYIKQNLPMDERTLYASLDNIWFSEHKLYEMTDMFVKRGGLYLFLDEVHKYPNWSQELKNIYDDFPELKVVFTGSSLLEILNARADLSRRAVVYDMQGFSYREYLNRNYKTSFPVYPLESILTNHVAISQEITADFKILQHFQEYLKFGYYPFYNELPPLYYQRLGEVINMILEVELPLLRKVDIAYIPKIKQLLQIISESVPFIPNVSKLSARIGITRNSLLAYLNALEESEITNHINKSGSGIGKLQKPDKVYLNNTNLMYALAAGNINTGSLRETFFANQLKYKHALMLPNSGDFLIDNKLTIEVGGKDKDRKQIEGLDNAFIAADDIEFGYKNRIPLWLFGFLY